MQDLLSQDEIDALLHGVDDGDIDTYEETDDTGIKSYDLASQDRIVRGRMPTLEMINERFARYTRISLFNLMRRNADVSTGGVQIMKFGEYIHTLYVPTSLNLCKVRAVRLCSSSTPSWCSSWWTISLAGRGGTPRSRVASSPRPRPASCRWFWIRCSMT